MHKVVLVFFLQLKLASFSFTDGSLTDANDLVPGRPFFPYQHTRVIKLI